LPDHPGQVFDHQQVDQFALFVKSEVFNPVDPDLSICGVEYAVRCWQIAGVGASDDEADRGFIAVHHGIQVRDLDVRKWHSKAGDAFNELVAAVYVSSIRVDVEMVGDKSFVLVPFVIVEVLISSASILLKRGSVDPAKVPYLIARTAQSPRVQNPMLTNTTFASLQGGNREIPKENMQLQCKQLRLCLLQ
jgi:hypothetical protein